MSREKRDTPQRAKRIGKPRKEREGKKSMSEANPYKFTKTILDGTKRGSLQSPKTGS